jgi:Helix-turn-helix domain
MMSCGHDGPAVYTVADIATRWGVSPAQVTKLCRTGQLQHFRTGKTKGIRISAMQLATYEAGQVAP